MRKGLFVLLVVGIAAVAGGGLWLAAQLLGGEPSAPDLDAGVRWMWVGLIAGSALITITAAVLQLTRPEAPAKESDWTFLTSLGAGLFVYILLVRPLWPREWDETLPGPLGWMLPAGLTVGIAYVALRPFLRG